MAADFDASEIEIKIDPFPTQRALSDLWRAAWNTDAVADFKAVLTRSLTHVAAFHGDDMVGFANMAWDGGDHAFLVDVCVDPGYRDHGIGERLVDGAISAARRRNVRWIHVDYEPHLRDFYMKCGFKSTEAGILRVKD